MGKVESGFGNFNFIIALPFPSWKKGFTFTEQIVQGPGFKIVLHIYLTLDIIRCLFLLFLTLIPELFFSCKEE
jgi:hypothetical protein